MSSSSGLAVGLALGGVLLLGACSAAEQAAPVTETVTHTAQAPDEAGTSAAPSPTEAASSSSPGRGSDQSGDRSGDSDPVFAAIDAVLAAHPGAVVVDVDRDDGHTFDVDVVSGERILELEVDADGSVREDERDDDDVREARAATLTAADAIRQALERHPDGVLDQVELESDDGVLRWEIELDDDRRGDLAELEIPAT